MAKKKEEKKDALIAPTYKEKGTNLDRLNMSAFEPALKREIVGLLQEASTALTSIAKSHLQIGQILSRAKVLLESRGKGIFLAFVNEIPGMALTTAYRYINAYDHARTIFPEQILTKILASNMPMIGGPDQRFGKYTEAIKKTKLDAKLQKAIEDGKVSEEFADQWIKEAEMAYNASTKRGKHAKTPDPSTLQEEAFTAIRRRYLKLPDNKRTSAWLSTLFAYIAGACGYATPITVDPKKPPQKWMGQPNGDEKKAAEEGHKESKAAD